MSIFSRAVLIAAGMLLVSTLARSDGVGNPGFSSDGFTGGISNIGKTAPQPTGDVLMVDGTSLILQTDAASFICRAGGC